MSNAIQVHKITEAVAYLNGQTMLGKIEKVDMPDLEFMFEKFKAMGMVGELELPTTGIKELKGKIKFNSFYPDEMSQLNPFSYHQLQLRSSVQQHTNQGKTGEVPLVTFLTVAFKKFPFADGEQHKSQEFETEFTCSYIKQVYDGEEIVEFDAFANILKIGGADVLEQYRENVIG